MEPGERKGTAAYAATRQQDSKNRSLALHIT